MSTSGRSLFRLRYRTMVLLLALAVIFWSGFSYWSEYRENSARLARERLSPPLGVPCQVVLSGADLVMKQTPMSPATVTGSENSLSGKIVDQSDRWIVLAPQDDDATVKTWIPRERILMIRVE